MSTLDFKGKQFVYSHHLGVPFREMGVSLVISTDAHATGDLDSMRFGVAVARRGWCEAKDILNTRPVEEFLSFLHRGA
ncbi:MAG: polymerase [Dehalococcoidia bacterium]|nr:polymerase [Dehalococcoidia bacterium]